MPRRTSQCRSCPTRQICLGAGLDAPQLDELGECMQPVGPLHRGEYLFRAGDPVEGCYLVRSGVYKSVAVDIAGAEHVTGFYYPGELLGLPGLARGVAEESAVAIDTATACRVGADMLPRLWAIGSGASMLRLIGRHDRQATVLRISLTQSRADCRVARFLIELAERMRAQGRDPRVLAAPMSRTDLAGYLGMTLESLSRVFSRFARTKLITATRTEVTLHQPDRLQALAYPIAD